MAPSALEVKVKCCRDLKAFNFFQKLSVYAVVSVASEDPGKKQKTVHAHRKTPIDREGDGNPEWNHEIRFDLPNLDLHQENHLNLFLEFQFLCEVMVFGDKPIGEVRVPMRDLVGESRGAVRFMSYQIRSTGNGSPNGVLDFSYKVIDDDDDDPKKKIDDDDDDDDDEDDNDNSSIVYPKIESSDFQVSLYPPLPTIHEPCCPRPEFVNAELEFGYPPPAGIHYPTREICYPYPPPQPQQIHFQAWEGETGAPPQMVYPPPPPDPYSTKINDYFYEFQASQHRAYVAGYRDVW